MLFQKKKNSTHVHEDDEGLPIYIKCLDLLNLKKQFINVMNT